MKKLVFIMPLMAMPLLASCDKPQEKNVTVIFNLNGGEIGGETISIVKSVKENTLWSDVVKPENPKKQDYTFKYWDIDNAGAIIPDDYKVNINMNVYAFYKKMPIVTFTKYNPSDTSETLSGVTVFKVDHESTFGQILQKPTASKTGYSFTNWFDKDTGNTITDTSIIKSDITIKPSYSINRYDLTFKLEGGTIGGSGEDVIKSVAYNTQWQYASKPSDPVDPHNQHFRHWSLSKDGEPISSTYALTGNTTVYAVYNYTITWNQDDGTFLKTTYVKYNNTPSYGGTPTKPSTETIDYTFDGWNPSVYAATKDETYQAHYSESTRYYKVYFYGGSGTITGETEKNVTYETTFGSISDKPVATKTGYDFDKWRLNSETGTPIGSEYVIKSSISVYASFTKHNYDVSVISTSGDVVSTNKVFAPYYEAYGATLSISTSGKSIHSIDSIKIGDSKTLSEDDYSFDLYTRLISIKPNLIDGDVSIKVVTGTSYVNYASINYGEVSDYTVTLSNNEVKERTEYSTTISLNELSPTHSKPLKLPKVLTSVYVGDTLLDGKKYTYELDDTNYLNTAYLTIPAKFFVHDEGVTINISLVDVVWYEASDWWNFCSNGVEGQQASSSDICKTVSLSYSNEQKYQVELCALDRYERFYSDEKTHCCFVFKQLISLSSKSANVRKYNGSDEKAYWESSTGAPCSLRTYCKNDVYNGICDSNTGIKNKILTDVVVPNNSGWEKYRDMYKNNNKENYVESIFLPSLNELSTSGGGNDDSTIFDCFYNESWGKIADLSGNAGTFWLRTPIGTYGMYDAYGEAYTAFSSTYLTFSRDAVATFENALLPVFCI